MNYSMNDSMDDSIDDLCEKMNYTQVNNQPNYHFINDFNIIIDEIISEVEKYNIELELNYLTANCQTCEIPDLDVYDILVSCGHALTWSLEYELTQYDFFWLKNNGKDYFLNKINESINLNILSNYYKILPCYIKLVELYELQVVV